ncbi:MAG: hypothetical protein AAGI72_13195 [Pseudomonadota bacterium]
MNKNAKSAAFTTLLASIVTLQLVAFSDRAQANENQLSYEVEAGYEFNDNVRLQTEENEIDISGFKVSVPVNFESTTERFTGEINARAEVSRFDESDYDSDDQRIEGRTSYKFERGEGSLYALINRDTTRDSEFLDTGLVGLSASRREAIEGGGSGDIQLTETSGLLAEFHLEDVSYEAERFSDFEYGIADLGWSLQYNSKLRYQVQLHGSRFESKELLGTVSDGLGFKVGFQSDFTERSSLKILAGWLDVDSDYDEGNDQGLTDDSAGTHLVDAQYRYKAERSDFTATWISAPLPSGNGFLRVTDQLNLRYRYSLSEFSRVSFNIIAGRRGIIEERVEADRDYVRFGIRLERRLSESWVLSGRYIYSQQDRERVSGTASANEVQLSLVFRPAPSVW